MNKMSGKTIGNLERKIENGGIKLKEKTNYLYEFIQNKKEYEEGFHGTKRNTRKIRK